MSAQPLEFPQPVTPAPRVVLVEKYRPRLLSEFIGLEKPLDVMCDLVAEPFSSNYIFAGPSGTGKTTLAQAVAEAIPAELHLIPSQECTVDRIAKIRARCQCMPLAGFDFHLILIEEADQISSFARTALLSKLDSADPAPNTIWILTTNDKTALEDRLRSRCQELDFSSYGIAKEAAALLERVWMKEAPANSAAPNFQRIVKERNNNVRASLQDLQTELARARRHARQ